MTQEISSTSDKQGPVGGLFQTVPRRAAQKAHNKRYGKYTEQYQYVTRFFSDCHRAQLAPLGGLTTNDHRNRIRSGGNEGFSTCENLLRNDLVLQQVCAC